MKRVLLATALALPVLASHAQPAATVPWMTGARLTKLMGNVDARTVEWSPDGPFRSRAVAAEFFDMANGEFINGYIHAVRDATEGRRWCWIQYKPKPDELVADVKYSLQKMTARQLERNAADLIVEVWQRKFPCSSHNEKGNK